MFRPLPVTQLTEPVFAERATGQDLPVFHPKDITLRSVGKAMSFQQESLFQAYGLPRNLLLEFRLLSKPCSIVRDVTLKALKTLDVASNHSSVDSRIVITGDSGCGKSFLLLQSVNYALSSGWLVLYIPRAISLLNSSTRYQYDLRSRTYQQSAYAQQILRRFASVNEKALRLIHTQDAIRIEKLRAFGAGTPLTEIIQAGVMDATASSDILVAVMEQLGQQTTHPVLVAVDDFQALYCTSEYRDPQYNLIQSHHLSIPRLLLEYAGGLKTLSRGAFLGAFSSTNTHYITPLELREALGMPYDRPVGPYARRSAAKLAYTNGLRRFEVPPQLNVNEAAALFEVWSRDLALHTGATDELFLSKYTASSGNARQFVWKGLLATLES
ncbi:hypothetical protein K439DRAFT_1665739 [Ramaria rubella]|nr:hypothetical protein K439DRAFT_1665739 [Ramaria rubella]